MCYYVIAILISSHDMAVKSDTIFISYHIIYLSYIRENLRFVWLEDLIFNNSYLGKLIIKFLPDIVEYINLVNSNREILDSG